VQGRRAGASRPSELANVIELNWLLKSADKAAVQFPNVIELNWLLEEINVTTRGISYNLVFLISPNETMPKM
jgi:hypothetical protein